MVGGELLIRMKGGMGVIELDNGVFMNHVEELVEQKKWSELRAVLRLLEPADIALILAELPLDRLPLLYRLNQYQYQCEQHLFLS